MGHLSDDIARSHVTELMCFFLHKFLLKKDPAGEQKRKDHQLRPDRRNVRGETRLRDAEVLEPPRGSRHSTLLSGTLEDQKGS